MGRDAEAGGKVCGTEIVTAPPPLLLLPTYQPSYSSLTAACEELKLFPYVQFQNGVCSLWQPLLHPAAAATCVFPGVSAGAGVAVGVWVGVCGGVCGRGCVCGGVRGCPCTRTCAPDIGTVPPLRNPVHPCWGEILIHSSFLPLLS